MPHLTIASGDITTILVIALALYFLPALIASNKHRNAGAIFALNLLLGWTFVGWVVALVWSLTKDGVVVTETGSDVVERVRSQRPEYQTVSQPPDHSFEPDGVLNGLPYRVLEHGAVAAMMKGGLVRFRDMDQFLAAVDGRDSVKN